MSNLDPATTEISFKDKVKDRCLTLLNFFKHPIRQMRYLPDWPWQELIFLMGAFAAACGVLQGIVGGRLLNIIASTLFLPIVVLIFVGMFSGFFYYVFLYFYRRELDFKKVFTNVMFASLPAVVLSILSPLLTPLNLIGVLTAAFLLVVGFSENFNLPKKKIAKLIAGLSLIYLIFWIYSSISFQKEKTDYRDQASPESVEILERELKGD